MEQSLTSIDKIKHLYFAIVSNFEEFNIFQLTNFSLTMGALTKNLILLTREISFCVNPGWIPCIVARPCYRKRNSYFHPLIGLEK